MGCPCGLDPQSNCRLSLRHSTCNPTVGCHCGARPGSNRRLSLRGSTRIQPSVVIAGLTRNPLGRLTSASVDAGPSPTGVSTIRRVWFANCVSGCVAAGGIRRRLILWRSPLRCDFAVICALEPAGQNSLRSAALQLRSDSCPESVYEGRMKVPFILPPAPERKSQPPQKSPPSDTACRDVDTGVVDQRVEHNACVQPTRMRLCHPQALKRVCRARRSASSWIEPGMQTRQDGDLRLAPSIDTTPTATASHKGSARATNDA